jgi:hypothetical protein
MSYHGKKTKNPGWFPGGNWVTCQRCDFNIRSWDAMKEWTGAIVCPDCWEPRHPQDFVRGIKDDPRPRGLVNVGLGDGLSVNLAEAEDTGLPTESTFGGNPISDDTPAVPTKVALFYPDPSNPNPDDPIADPTGDDGETDPDADINYFPDNIFNDVNFSSQPEVMGIVGEDRGGGSTVETGIPFHFMIRAIDSSGNRIPFENLNFPSDNLIIHCESSNQDFDFTNLTITHVDLSFNNVNYGGKGTIKIVSKLMAEGQPNELIRIDTFENLSSGTPPDGTLAQASLIPDELKDAMLDEWNETDADLHNFAYKTYTRLSQIQLPIGTVTSSYFLNKTAESGTPVSRIYAIDVTNPGFETPWTGTIYGLPPSTNDAIRFNSNWVTQDGSGNIINTAGVMSEFGVPLDTNVFTTTTLRANNGISSEFIELYELGVADVTENVTADLDGQSVHMFWPCYTASPTPSGYSNDDYNITPSTPAIVYEEISFEEF